MIKDHKIICFGYGSIIPQSAMSGLKFTWIEPPQEIGCAVDMDNVEVIEEIYVYLNFAELVRIENELNKINSTIKIKGCILDFSKYNKQSIRVLKSAITAAMQRYILTYAS